MVEHISLIGDLKDGCAIEGVHKSYVVLKGCLQTLTAAKTGGNSTNINFSEYETRVFDKL